MVEKRVCLSLPTLVRRPLRSEGYVAPTAYRKLLLEVAYKLGPWDVEELRFFVKDAVPDETAAEALTALGLLECLERHKLLGPEEYTHLRKYLKDMGREDLAALLAPPEDIKSAPVSVKPASSVGLGRIIGTRLVTTAWPYSSYRRCALEVFRELTEEEVEQMRWLSMDFFETKPATHRWGEQMTGVNLLDVMEDNKLIGPGNYTFLLNCLEEIGRRDLVLMVLPPDLPYLPPSLDIPALLKWKRIENIQLKKTQYQFGMNSLVTVRQFASQNVAKNAGGWYKRILGALSPKSLEMHSSYIIENLPETLINTSLHINALLDAIEEYERNGDTAKLAMHLAECEEPLDILQNLMERIEWDNLPRKREKLATSRQYHPVRQASYGAFSGVAELFLEFSARKDKFQEEARYLGSLLERLESLLRLAGYMWSLTSWLIALLQVAVRSPICLDQYDFLFRVLVNRNKHIIRSNSGMLEAVLGSTPVGRKLLETFRDKNLVSDVPSSENAVLLHMSATPIPVFAFVVLVLSEHPSLAAKDLEEIVAALKEYISERQDAFCQVNASVTMTVLNGIYSSIEAFRNSKIQEVCSDNVHGIEEIFSL
jgi:hypothetical protein